MKIYEVITSDYGTCIRVTIGETISFIPLDPANSDYAEYLRYNEWVEAGNNPEDFWTQTDELTEPTKKK